MPGINWSFLCDYAFADEKGRASIIRTFSHIHAPRLPIRYPQLFLALEFIAQKGEDFSIGAVIIAPSGKQVARAELNRKGKGENSGGTEKGFLPLGFYHLLFEEEGEHHVEIFINGSSVHYMPLMVRAVQTPKKKN